MLWRRFPPAAAGLSALHVLAASPKFFDLLQSRFTFDVAVEAGLFVWIRDDLHQAKEGKSRRESDQQSVEQEAA
jgi:hypothetical protein